MELPPKPEHIHNLEFVRILTPYVFARQIVADKTVLDVGCGFGNGAWLLAMSGAVRVIALDIKPLRVRQATEFCKQFPNFCGLVMDGQKLAFKDRAFQVVTCFEVIEHVPQPDMLLSELRRILRKDGVLLLTTPNRVVRLSPLQRPWNPEHLREYTLKALQRTLQGYFPLFAIMGIYGEPKFHEFYRRMWQQNSFRVYFGWTLQIMRVLTPISLRRWVRNQLVRIKSARALSSLADLLNIAIPVPNPENWPFYVSDVNEHCLNFLAICGFDGQTVQRVVNKIKRSV